MTNNNTKIVTIIGARPQFIKAAAVSRAIQKLNKQSGQMVISEIIVHTGQHYDENMSKVFFEEMDIPEPAYNLEVGSGLHGKQTGLMLERIEDVLIKEKPDFCLTYGDTNSTAAGALAAVKMHIPVGHVEAGLRSFNRKMPEEINRIVADHISALLFCPTDTAVENLKNEGIVDKTHLTGDVMFDCTLFYSKKAEVLEESLYNRLNIQPGDYYLATVHRAENTDDPVNLTEIIAGLNEIVDKSCPVILPLHPRTVNYLKQYGLETSEYLRILEPVSYLTMVSLEKNAKKILTDSGGVQKEAFFLSVPCITMRDQTEWVETVESGWNTLVGANRDRIVKAATAPNPSDQTSPDSFYGNGHSAEVITQLIKSFDGAPL